MFLRSPAISGTGDGSFRSPRSALGPVLLPITSCAAVWGYRNSAFNTTHRPIHLPCTAARQQVQQCSSTLMRSLLLYRIGISMFLPSPAISGTGDGSFRLSPLAEFGVGARSSADKTLCGRVGRPWRSCRGADGARESRSKTEYTKTEVLLKIQSDTTSISEIS